MKLISSRFSNFQDIPEEYTGLGANINPPLKIVGSPKKTKSFILWVEDVDTPLKPWVHWLIFNMPVSLTNIKEGDERIKQFEGLANGGTFGYEGPNQKYFTGTHHYRFRVFALNKLLDIPKESKKAQVEEVMKGCILDQAQLIGMCTSPLSSEAVSRNLGIFV